jgi:hypothetical protein
MISCNDDFLSWKVPQEACERCGLSFCSTDLMLSLSHSGSKPDHVRPLYLDKGLYYLRELRDAYQRLPRSFERSITDRKEWGSWVFRTILMAVLSSIQS